jgi:hypothetical protein
MRSEGPAEYNCGVCGLFLYLGQTLAGQKNDQRRQALGEFGMSRLIRSRQNIRRISRDISAAARRVAEISRPLMRADGEERMCDKDLRSSEVVN